MTTERDRRKLVLIDEAEKEAALFFVRWLRAPHRIGAVAPSSRHLGRAMARQVLSAGPGPVVELGGGTGAFSFCHAGATRAPGAAGSPAGAPPSGLSGASATSQAALT